MHLSPFLASDPGALRRLHMLKKPRSWLAVIALTAVSMSSLWTATNAHAQIGVSVSVNQPGVYGRIDIGDHRPTVVYQEPIIVHRSAYSMHQRPIYMHVPPGHYKQWSRYCQQYRACNQPVYFVERPFNAHPRPAVKKHAPPHHVSPRHDRHEHDQRAPKRDGQSRLKTDRGGPPHQGGHGHGGHR